MPVDVLERFIFHFLVFQSESQVLHHFLKMVLLLEKIAPSPKSPHFFLNCFPFVDLVCETLLELIKHLLSLIQFELQILIFISKRVKKPIVPRFVH